MPSFWEKLRRDFPVTKKYIYLDHASGGIIPLPVHRKTVEHSESLLTEGDFAWPRWLKTREQIREKAARFIGAEHSEIAFTNGTSHGMNLIAEIIAAEGQVLTNESEFPSTTVPWIWRKAKVTFQKEEDGKISVEKMKTLLSPKIKTILTSYVQYATGFRQDLETIGKMKGSRYFIVNATQGCGVLPVDVQKWQCDFLVTNSFKWLMAGYGCGLLFIRNQWLERFDPSSVGWRSMQNPDAMDNRKLDVRKDAARYELGGPSFMTIFRMGAAIDYLTAIGIDKIEKRVLSLTDYAVKEITKAGFEIVSPRDSTCRSAIVVFKTDRPQKIWRECLKHKIFVSARGKGLRLAPHFYNTFEDLDVFLRVLKNI